MSGGYTGGLPSLNRCKVRSALCCACRISLAPFYTRFKPSRTISLSTFGMVKLANENM